MADTNDMELNPLARREFHAQLLYWEFDLRHTTHVLRLVATPQTEWCALQRRNRLLLELVDGEAYRHSKACARLELQRR